jgi:hypothetical protein
VNMAPLLSIILAPNAAAAADQRARVGSAFTGEGFENVDWRGLPGDPSFVVDGEVAPPALTIVVRGIDEVDMWPFTLRLARALAQVRASTPELPIVVAVVVRDGIRRLAFSPTDSPGAVASGMKAMGPALKMREPVVGWDARLGRWLPV